MPLLTTVHSRQEKAVCTAVKSSCSLSTSTLTDLLLFRPRPSIKSKLYLKQDRVAAAQPKENSFVLENAIL